MNKVTSLMLASFLSVLALSSCSGPSSSSVSESSVNTSETTSESSSIIVTYTITFEENGGSTVSDITQEPGSSVNAPSAPTKTGYTFGGWYSDSGLTSAYTFLVMPSQNITLYAKWTINQYSITFETNGGSAIAPLTQDYLSSVSAPTSPTRTGYSFIGWYADIALTTPYMFSTMPLNGATVYAKWQINQYTISFNSNGGSEVAAITQDYGTVVSEPADPTRLGYEFEGWYANETLIIPYVFTTIPEADITLYAKWEIAQFTISFETNGGSSVSAITQDYGTSVTPPIDPTRMGYIFGGWFSDEDLTVLFAFTTMPAEDLTLYAKWEADPLFGVITIAEFKGAADTAYHEVAGVVLFAAAEQMSFIVIADETQTLLVMTESTVVSGDFVKVGGYIEYMDDYVFMTAEDLSTTLKMILSHDQTIPLPITEMTLGDFMAFDPNMSSTWIRYIELTGTLTIDPVEHIVSLVDGTDSVPLTVIDMETYLLFTQYKYFEISVRGITVPNFDAEPFLMFFYTGVPTDISMDYTSQELVTLFATNIGDYFGSIDCIAGEVLDFPVDHELVPVVITYETFGANAGLFDVLTFQVAPTIESETYIDVRVTATLPDANASAEFQLHVVPLVPTSIATFLSMPDDETTYYNLQGVVIYQQLANNFIMIADATAVCYVITSDTTLSVGDEVVVNGVKMSNEGMTFLANEPSITIRAWISSDNPMPLAPIPITITDFMALDINEPTNSMVYFSLTGMLYEDVEGHRYYLSDGTHNIPIYIPSEDAYPTLSTYIGTNVFISGLSTPVPEHGFMMLVYFALPGTIASA